MKIGRAGPGTMVHSFGGPWTEIKLDAVQYYLECYSKALTPRRFGLWYVDAFAGSGDRTETTISGGGLLGEVIVTQERLPGSARRALEIQPPFHHFVFNDKKRVHRNALAELQEEFPSKDIEILGADANEAMRELFASRSGGARLPVRRGRSCSWTRTLAGEMGNSRVARLNGVR